MSRKTKLHASHIALDCSVDSHSTQARQHHCEHYPTQVFVSCGKDASSSVNITWVTSSGAAASTVLVPVVALCTTTTVCHVGRHPCDNPFFIYVATCTHTIDGTTKVLFGQTRSLGRSQTVGPEHVTTYALNSQVVP